MKVPLKPKRTDFSFKSGVFDFKYIREHAGENPFGIKPDLKPLVACTNTGCPAQWDPNKGLWTAGCTGMCYGC